MNSFKEVMLALLFLVHGNHAITIFTSNTATVTYPFDSFAISCGSSRIMIDKDGRDWLKDVGYTSSSSLRSKSTIRSAPHQTAIGVDPTPYKQARISHHEFTYMFHVRPGQKFIRLHFFKAAYDGFQKSSANFSVKSGKFTLISNFNLALDADASADKIIVKEFCVNIKENEELDIVFSPLGEAKSKDVYAFINGIEIVSMPAGLYFTPHIDTELGAKVIGQRKYKFHVDDNETVLEMVRRLNIGGNSIPSFEDGSLFRGWDSDSGSLSQADYGLYLWIMGSVISFGSTFVNLNLKKFTINSAISTL